ncbi:threonine/serine dehydratase [Salinicoccus albus]|uniref:threonine/serine dehydratase n=1 Tax=Salinicoccus albus TaxID=418756 RepID=UPI000371CF0C|nr:threonine/serine dehydratase [Salinicoccus albus]
MAVSLEKIQNAHVRIAPYINETPLIRMHHLDDISGCKIFAKLENMQKTHAFKIRGVLNRFLQMEEETRNRGVIAASSGNHGKAVSFTAKQLGIHATVVVPYTASEFKVEEIKKQGAKVVFSKVEERMTMAKNLAERHGYINIPPYDDEDVIAGQGTVGLEILSQQPGLDYVIVPTSGGGLLGGISTAIKRASASIKVYGAEPSALPRYTNSLSAGRLTRVPAKETIADALVTDQPGEKNFPIVQKYSDGMLSADDETILKAMELLLSEGKILAEPSASITLAALMEDKLDAGPNDKVCLVLSGGNAGLDYFANPEG